MSKTKYHPGQRGKFLNKRGDPADGVIIDVLSSQLFVEFDDGTDNFVQFNTGAIIEVYQ